MVTYLSTPGNQMQADHVRGMPVLVSYGALGKQCEWIGDYLPSFGRVLLDSGAFSELNSGVKVDLDAYAEWAAPMRPWVDAVAALDDIRGDWERGLENWRRYPWMFPTYHDTDPPEALDVILKERPRWVGLGMLPDAAGRRSNAAWLYETLERIPPGVHVHGWALRTYTACPRLDSVDSTNWFRDSFKIKKVCPWLTPAECVEIIVKRYQRESRKVKAPAVVGSGQGDLFGCEA